MEKKSGWMDESWRRPSAKEQVCIENMICNLYSKKYGCTMGLCAVIKWPFSETSAEQQ